MPIANSNTGGGFRGALAYALQEGKKIPSGHERKVMAKNGICGQNSKEMAKLMRNVANENQRVKKPVLHLRVNFDPSEELTEERQMSAVKDIMQGVGLDDRRQYLIVKHKDKKHEHYHIIANRVDFQGKCLENKHMNRRLIVEADRVEKQQGLKQTEGRTLFYDPSTVKGYRNATKEERPHTAQKSIKDSTKIDKREAVQAVRELVQGQVSDILKNRKISSPEALKTALAEQGIETKFSTNKNGIYGVSFRDSGIAIKGSAIGYKWKEVKKLLEANNLIDDLDKQVAQSKEQSTREIPIEIQDRFIGRLNAFRDDILQQYQANESRISGQKIEPPIQIDVPNTAAKYNLQFEVQEGRILAKCSEDNLQREAPNLLDLEYNLNRELAQQRQHYKAVLAYSQAIGRQEKKISLKDWFTGKAFEKRAFNKAIRQEKAEAIAPAIHSIKVGGKIFDLMEQIKTPSEVLKEQRQKKEQEIRKQEREKRRREQRQQRKNNPDRKRRGPRL